MLAFGAGLVLSSSVQADTTARFVNYPAPSDSGFYAQGTQGWGTQAGETSIGVDPRTNNVMFQMLLTTARVRFDDRRDPAAPSWTNVSFALNAQRTSDPILWTDRDTGRTFVSHLETLPDVLFTSTSIVGFTDDDGDHWQLTQPPISFPGYDHETVGTGPYASPAPVRPSSYTNAVYYCANEAELPDETPSVGGKGGSQCTRSDNGGLTWGPPTPMQLLQCIGGHGHLVVGRDGTAYVPHNDCGSTQGVLVSQDNGVSWQLRRVRGTVPASLDTGCVLGLPNCTKNPHLFGDPKVAIDRSGRLYFGTSSEGKPVVATSTDRGLTWSRPIDVGKQFGLANTVFPMTIAGTAGRAAFAFYGTTTAGDDQSAAFKGIWHLYVAVTLDGGGAWQTTDVTPDDPVQRGCVWLQGGGSTCRNLLDFQDMTLDRDGRLLIGYADGCTSAKCIGPTGTPEDSRDARGVIARQDAGPQLLRPLPGSHTHSPLELPTSRSCSGRRNLVIRLHSRRRDPLRDATIRINGRRVRVLRGRQLSRRVNLTGVPNGRFTLSIVAHTRGGRTLRTRRTYRACSTRSP